MSDVTPSQTVGPYLAIGLPWETGPVAFEGGVQLSGQVLDGAGTPVPDVMVELWCPEPVAFARSCTDDAGAGTPSCLTRRTTASTCSPAGSCATPDDAGLPRRRSRRSRAGERACHQT